MDTAVCNGSALVKSNEFSFLFSGVMVEVKREAKAKASAEWNVKHIVTVQTNERADQPLGGGHAKIEL